VGGVRNGKKKNADFVLGPGHKERRKEGKGADDTSKTITSDVAANQRVLKTTG